jgi:hypothetical protein
MGDLPTPTKVEQFNSLIRGGVLSVLTVAFGWKFLDGTVSTDAFISIYAGVLGWWFATRGQTPQPSVTTTTPSATTTATVETKP